MDIIGHLLIIAMICLGGLTPIFVLIEVLAEIDPFILPKIFSQNLLNIYIYLRFILFLAVISFFLATAGISAIQTAWQLPGYVSIHFYIHTRTILATIFTIAGNVIFTMIFTGNFATVFFL